MRISRYSVTACLILACGSAVAQSACSAGQGRLKDGDPCIPNYLVNYLYCLGQSGGGKVEIKRKDDSTRSTNLEVAIGGKGSGVVIKGEGTGTVKSSEATRVIKELDEKLDPLLTKNCKDFASPPKAALPAVPPYDEASGTASAEVTLPPQRAPLSARLSATATAHISPDGWMEVKLSANDEQCKPNRVYKNPTSGNMHTATASCNVVLKQNLPYTFRVEAPNYNADAHTTKITVNYWR